MPELRPLTPGVAPLKPGVVFGRDTSTTARPLGIAHPQVSRVQGRTCAKPDGTLEVVALGIGRMRVHPSQLVNTFKNNKQTANIGLLIIVNKRS